MTTPSPPRSGMFMAHVVRRRTPCSAHFELTLSMPTFPEAVPGQFVQVWCGPPAEARGTEAAQRKPLPQRKPRLSSGAPLLRRPFSIGGLRRGSNHCEVSLLGRVIGSGTEWLASLSEGDAVDLIGPLGRGFTLPARGSRVLLVAGGVGLPPIRWLGEVLSPHGCRCEALYGAKTRDFLPFSLMEEPRVDGVLTHCAAEFAEAGVPLAVTTDDGSCGMPGRVTDRLARYLEDCRDPAALRVYACGPEPMLRTTASLCAAHGIACEVALERRMGCGMGTCQSCVVRVREPSATSGWRYALCCTEGPVFDAAGVLWG